MQPRCLPPFAREPRRRLPGSESGSPTALMRTTTRTRSTAIWATFMRSCCVCSCTGAALSGWRGAARERRRPDGSRLRLERLRPDRARCGEQNVGVVFTIFGTPAWANGGGPPTRAPTKAADLRSFAYAAAERYGGTFERADGTVLPARPVLDGLERAEPADRSYAAVEEGRRALGDPERARLRAHLQRRRRRRQRARSSRASASRAATPPRVATTRRRAAGRRRRRSRSCGR